jgi:hypothetical protein
MFKCLFCPSIFLFIFLFKGMSQLDSLKKLHYLKCDTISMAKFNQLVKSSLKQMRKNLVYTKPEQVIPLVKIYHTRLSNLNAKQEKRYEEFSDLYRQTYMGMACEILDCSPLAGLEIYSRPYDLYLSRTKDTMQCYNYYHIR